MIRFKIVMATPIPERNYFYCLYSNKETNAYLLGIGAAITTLEQISHLPALQYRLTSVSAIQPVSGLDRVIRPLFYNIVNVTL